MRFFLRCFLPDDDADDVNDDIDDAKTPLVLTLAPEVVTSDDNDSDDDNDNDNQQDYWQPRNPNRRGWVPNRRYFDDQYRTGTNLNPSAEYAALLHDFGLLSEEEAFLANLGTSSCNINGEIFQTAQLGAQLLKKLRVG